MKGFLKGLALYAIIGLAQVEVCAQNADDHNFDAGVTDANGGTVDADEISTDDLLVIAKVLEDTYQNAEEV